MMKKTTIMLLLLGLTAFAATASAVQMFDFDAQAIMPVSAGSAATVYGRIVNGVAVATPLPLDFANYEYTIVVTGLMRDTVGTSSLFSGGSVAIYQDAATASVWTSPSTFSDGIVVLSGTLATFERTMLTSTLGSGAGVVDWTGGTMLDMLAPADQLDWRFLTSVSRATSQVQPGFNERWDGKVEPRSDVVSTQQRSWSELKAAFR
jgi:hypothetical protein